MIVMRDRSSQRRGQPISHATGATSSSRLLEATELLTQGEATPVRARPAVWIGLNLRHVRALLARDEAEAQRGFDDALAADLGSWPFQRVRLLLPTASGSVASGESPTPATPCALPATCSTASAAPRGANAPGESCVRQASRAGAVTPPPATS